MGKKTDAKKKDMTIKEFQRMVTSEWESLSPQEISFNEWLNERSDSDRKLYGVYYDYDTDEYLYGLNNANCPGEDICVFCFKQCEADENGLCSSCAEEQGEVEE